ncbi:NlpC/P60 family protein [Spirillospora sp. NPDC029432]|uniref:C40 family peptidase n=1 Tax=Spirillospora sp. NPDC029432 TaxID=3154599 RepID=UPI0034533983
MRAGSRFLGKRNDHSSTSEGFAMGIQHQKRDAYAPGRMRRTGRMAPQAAGCLLAATMLVTIPSAAEAAAAEPAPQAPEAGEPRPKDSSARRLRIDPASMKQVRAYNRYQSKIARQRERARTALRFARAQIGKPYRWGATGPYAYDCSGLVQKAWRRAGVKIPRVTYSQYSNVRRKVGWSSMRPGDLIFFRGRAHVGMYVSKNRFIHAPNSGSRVRINKLSGHRKRQFAGAVRPGAPAVKKWPDSIPRLAERLEEMNRQDQQHPPAAEQAPPAPKTANSGNDSPAPNSPAISPQNEAPPGPHQGPAPDRPKPESPPGSSDPDHIPDIAVPGREEG